MFENAGNYVTFHSHPLKSFAPPILYLFSEDKFLNDVNDAKNLVIGQFGVNRKA